MQFSASEHVVGVGAVTAAPLAAHQDRLAIANHSSRVFFAIPVVFNVEKALLPKRGLAFRVLNITLADLVQIYALIQLFNCLFQALKA